MSRILAVVAALAAAAATLAAPAHAGVVGTQRVPLNCPDVNPSVGGTFTITDAHPHDVVLNFYDNGSRDWSAEIRRSGAVIADTQPTGDFTLSTTSPNRPLEEQFKAVVVNRAGTITCKASVTFGAES